MPRRLRREAPSLPCALLPAQKSIIMMAFFLDDADEQNHSDEGDDAEIRTANQKCKDGPNTRGR